MTTQVTQGLLKNNRYRLSQNTSYYVSTTGNDTTGNGSFSSPWATIQKAINYIQKNIDLCGYFVTINVAAGTYAGFCVSGPFVGENSYPIYEDVMVSIVGDTSNPSNVVITSSTTSTVVIARDARVAMRGFKITCTSTTNGDGHNIIVKQGGRLYLNGNMNFGNVLNYHIITVDSASFVFITSSYTLSGGGEGHILSILGSQLIYGSNVTITITGTPTFTWAFVAAQRLGFVNIPAGTIFSGSCTGRKFQADLNAVIFTNGVTLPGSTAGSSTYGAQVS